MICHECEMLSARIQNFKSPMHIVSEIWLRDKRTDRQKSEKNMVSSDERNRKNYLL